MYLYNVKTVIAEGLRQVFNSTFPVDDFRNLHISLEYPMQPGDYPGIWVDFEQVGNLTRGGIDSNYVIQSSGEYVAADIWRFKGYALYTVAAFTSLQRDRLFDELTRIFAFSLNDLTVYPFRQYIENNNYIAMNMDFDDISVQGMAATPGTPWGDESKIIYEVTVGMECVGEFVDDLLPALTIPALEHITIEGTVLNHNQPAFTLQTIGANAVGTGAIGILISPA